MKLDFYEQILINGLLMKIKGEHYNHVGSDLTYS